VGTRGSTTSEAERENYLVFSLFGTAPDRFEMDNSISVSEDNDIALYIEIERINNRRVYG